MQLRECRRNALAVVKQEALSYFDLDPLRTATGFLQYVRDRLRQMRALKLLGRQIYRDLVRGQSICIHGGSRQTRLMQHPASEIDDQSGFFGDTYEFARRDHSHLRMMPSKQGF
ncbi:hypothetical protein D3C87_1661310 [compost metagenome]